MALSSTLSLFLFLLWIYVVSANENCPFASASPNLTNVKWNSGVCYFTVKEATTEANTKVNGTHWTFNISAARRICAAQNATLPIFDDDQEHSFAHENYRGQFDGLDVSQLALGLHKLTEAGKEYRRWDDGSRIGHFKGASIGASPSGNADYAVLPLKEKQKKKQWRWYSSGAIWSQPIAVLCQRREAQPGKIRRMNMCETPIEYFPEIHAIARVTGRSEEMCLFVVTASSLIVNEKIDEKYVYNPEKARQLCQHYGATLPTVFNHEECKHLSSQFGTLHTIDRQVGNPTDLALGLPLGIAQAVSGDNFQYKWDTGEDIIYENVWFGKYTQAVYTKMTFDASTRHGQQTCVWQNVAENETATESPLMTICEHRMSQYTQPKIGRNKISVCSPASGTRVVKMATFEDACYFKLPIGASENMSIAGANDACRNSGGVLPTIASEKENAFLSATFHEAGDTNPAILGLRQMRRPDEYQWLDGSELTYAPSKWEGRESYAFATILVLNTGEWKNIPYFVFTDRQWIICKEVQGTAEETESTNTNTDVITTPSIEKSTSTPEHDETPSTTTTTAMSTATLEEVIMEDCPPNSSTANYVDVKWNSGVCYFTMQGATAHANKKINATHWTFNINEARKICAAQNATLPIFDNDKGNIFVHENYREQFDGLEVAQLALGLYKTVSQGKKYQVWDDGTEIRHFKDTSINDSQTDSSYAVLFITNTQKVKVWQWYRPNTPWDKPIALLCQRRQSHPGKIRRVNMCKTPPEYFPEVHQQTLAQMGNELCVFGVRNNTLIANVKIGDKYIYDVEIGRELCQRFGATLAMMKSYEECKFMRLPATALQSIEHRHTRVFPSPAVAMGLVQTASPRRISYKWQTGEALHYESPWPTKYVEASHTIVEFDPSLKCTWKSLGQHDTALSNPLLTLCQHRLKDPVRIHPAVNKKSICASESKPEGIDNTVKFNESCYFTLHEGERGSLNIELARNSCALFGGVLPSIGSDEENAFLASAFNKSSDAHSSAILGLKQMHRPAEYKWIQGSPLTFEPWQWEGQDKYAYATVLDFHTGDWKNMERFDVSLPPWILCKEVTSMTEETESTDTDEKATTPPEGSTTTRAPVTKEDCPPTSSNNATYVNVKWNNGVCYFAVEGGTLEANKQTSDNTHWTFDIYAARRICAAQKATLLIFDDNEEHSFVYEHYHEQFDGHEISQLALGLYKGTWEERGYRVWDDGTRIAKFADTSIVFPPGAPPYAVLYMTPKNRLKLWHWHYVKTAWDQPVAVLCQRRQPQPGKIRRVDMCDTPMEYFPEVHINARTFGIEELCLFVVTGSSHITNHHDGSGYVYNVEKARQLCKQYDATLPTVSNYEECVRLMRVSRDMRAVERDQGNILTRNEMALGITQEVSTNGIGYKWDTGHEVIYENVWWKKYRLAEYTKIGLSTNCDWENVLHDAPATFGPILTVCQQRLVEPDKPSMPGENKVSICSSKAANVNILKKAIFKSSCYFKLNSEHNHDMGTQWAMAACERFGGVLPVIKDKELNDFLADQFATRAAGNTSRAVLGLRQMRRPDEYQWIDDTPLSFAPRNWEHREEYAFMTVLVLETKEWKNVVAFDPKDKTWVICRDLTQPSEPPATSSTTTTTTTSKLTPAPPKTAPSISAPTLIIPTTLTTITPQPPPAMPIPNKPTHGEPCDKENHATYSKTLWHKTDSTHICYFIIPGATYNAALSPSFKIEEARETCAKHSATLPILLTQGEAEFVVRSFGHKEFDRDALKSIPWRNEETSGIVLNLNVKIPRSASGEPRTYTWDGGIPLKYAPPKWHNRDKDDHPVSGSVDEINTPFVILRDVQEEVIWDTLAVPPKRLTFAVLCERRVELKPEPTPEPQPEETTGGHRKFASISLLILGCVWSIGIV